MADIQGRSLTWAFITYPESLPDNWLSILRDLHVMGAISPLHNSDVDDFGVLKKEHYHNVLKFPSKKSLQQVYSIVRKLGCNVPPEPVESFEGYLRYLIHADDPDKAQYDKDKIIPLCGLDINSYFMPPKSEVSQIIYDIVGYLFDHPDLYEFDVLMGRCREYKNWGFVLANFPCYGVHKVLESRRRRQEKKEKKDDNK